MHVIFMQVSKASSRPLGENSSNQFTLFPQQSFDNWTIATASCIYIAFCQMWKPCQDRLRSARCVVRKNAIVIKARLDGDRKRTVFETNHPILDCQIFHGKTYQNGRKYINWPHNLPNCHKIYQMALKCTNILHSKTYLLNILKLGFLVWKYTISQPWFP
jgi:hypothetical protein